MAKECAKHLQFLEKNLKIGYPQILVVIMANNMRAITPLYCNSRKTFTWSSTAAAFLIIQEYCVSWQKILFLPSAELCNVTCWTSLLFLSTNKKVYKKDKILSFEYFIFARALLVFRPASMAEYIILVSFYHECYYYPWTLQVGM